ncbi:DUF1428 family protein [Virgibacillus doumboii]|uniref:DUF1428 family protein n=1 Tax=Virgibacillus doumboii TaxID=2697503 RepID=UPI0013DFB525|nr:DUF1428 family protein [Virgibacillus doumboii]
MYTIINLYRVKKEHVQSFIDINDRASEIYLSYGALEDNTYHASDLNGKHGCSGLIDIIDVKDDEVVFFGQSVFRNESHHDDVMSQVDDDPEIYTLFDEISKVIVLSKVVTATFSTDH